MNFKTVSKLDESIGFDLVVGDFVTPYGKGFHTDIKFLVHRNVLSDREFQADLAVSFPNKLDGIVVAAPESFVGSEFKTSRTAVDSGYQSELILNYSDSKPPESVFGYFFRVRTILDENGTIKSALYGKIRGDFRLYAGTICPSSGIGFDYYLNAMPNDRNVEFDRTNNLVKNLKLGEEVIEP